MLPLKTTNDLLVVKFYSLFSVSFNTSDQHLPLKGCPLFVLLTLFHLCFSFLSLPLLLLFTGLSPPFPGLPLTSILILSPGYLIQFHDMNCFYYRVLGPPATPELLILKGDFFENLSIASSRELNLEMSLKWRYVFGECCCCNKLGEPQWLQSFLEALGENLLPCF